MYVIPAASCEEGVRVTTWEAVTSGTPYKDCYYGIHPKCTTSHSAWNISLYDLRTLSRKSGHDKEFKFQEASKRFAESTFTATFNFFEAPGIPFSFKIFVNETSLF
jgi:hypothetical protein